MTINLTCRNMIKLLLIIILTIPGLFGISQEFSLDELIKIYNSSVDEIDDILLKKNLVFSNFITDEGHPNWIIYHYADQKLKDTIEQSVSVIFWVDTALTPDHILTINLDSQTPDNYLELKSDAERIGMKKIEAELVNKRFIHSKYEGARYLIVFNHDIVATELPFSVVFKKK
jgi:hypothetical protein